MTKKLTIGAKAFLLCFALIEQAHAGYFHITFKSPPAAPPPAPPPVPEFDGAGAIAAIALLASIGAVLLSRRSSKT
jgi:hypothetical protein